MRSTLVVLVVVAVVGCGLVGWCQAERVDKDARDRYNRRLSPQERETILKNMRDSPPCKPPEGQVNNSKTLPSVPNSFTTKVEISYQKEKQMKVLYGAESYDGVFNMGVLQYELGEGVLLTRPYAQEEIIHYNVPGDEALFVITDTACEETGDGNCDPKKNCHAGNLESVSEVLQELFGYGDANGESGYFGAGGILQWGPQYEYQFEGDADCRGMRCEKYTACIYNDEDKATMRLVYYWSDPRWIVSSNGQQVPIAVEVTADGKFGHIFTRNVSQRYDFYEFFRDIRPDVDRLQPPADVYCKDRVSQFQPPKVPRYFSYNSEAITGFDLAFPTGDNQTQRVQFTAVFTNTEYYDWNSKVVQVEYTPWFVFGQEYRYEMFTRRVQDFNQGLVYYMLPNLGTCGVGRIENLTSAGDVIVDQNGTVSLQPPWVFEDMDEPMQYNGVHHVRGVGADTWVGQKKLLGPFLKDNIVWYYAAPITVDGTLLEVDSIPLEMTKGDLKGKSPGDKKKAKPKPTEPPVIVSFDSVPLRMDRYLNLAASLPHLVYNIYDYATEPPLTHTMDISGCYTKDQMLHFVVELPEDAVTKVHGLEDDLLYSAQQAMGEMGVVSPLRINKPVLDMTDGKVKILFTVLDKPKVQGDAPGTQLESSLDEAVNLIRKAVDKSQLIIIVHLDQFVITPQEPVFVVIVAKPNSMIEVTRAEASNDYSHTESKGYESGDMAGLAVGMLIMGALVGVGICFLMQRGSGSQKLPRVKLAHTNPTAATTVNFTADMTASDI